jgi:cell division protein FtsA
MSSSTVVGLDIGTSSVKVIVARENPERGRMPEIIGFGQFSASGLRHGYITNRKEAILSVRKAIRSAEKSANTKIKNVFLSVGGIGLSSYKTKGSVMITRADNEVTEMDLEKATDEALNQVPKQKIMNRRVIHNIPIEYYLDGNPVLGNPVGLKGVRLEAEVLFITSLEHHVSELIDVVEEAGLEVVDAMAAPLAASLVTLTKAEKIAGCAVVNIGSETLSIVVYEDDKPVSLEVFKIGSNDITNDIAIGLQVDLDEAEQIKKDNDKGESHGHPQKKLDNIVMSRLKDMFDLVDSHLQKIGKKGLLPAGIIITGGGSRVTTIEDIAKAYLNLPSKIADIGCGVDDKNCKGNVKIKDAAWAVSYGLCLFGLSADENGIIRGSSITDNFKQIVRHLGTFLKKFLP